MNCRIDSSNLFELHKLIIFYITMVILVNRKLRVIFDLDFRKLVKGFEPPTYGLQNRCSTIELHQQMF